MTSAENERLAVVESKVEALTQIVAKFDGKLEVVHNHVLTRQVRDEVYREQSAFRRWLAPIIVTVLNGLIAFAALLTRLIP